MNLASFLNRSNAENGLTLRHDRHINFRIMRQKNSYGFQIYILENTKKREKIIIPRYIFDRFRSAIKKLLSEEIDLENEASIDIRVYFKDNDLYTIKSQLDSPDKLLIRELKPEPGSTGFISLTYESIITLEKLLYDPRLEHPNDVLDRIIVYHKLFNFTFTHQSESITSSLVLRKDVLSQITKYIPSLGKRESDLDRSEAVKDEKLTASKKPSTLKAQDKKPSANLYKSKLAQRSGDKDYSVDYDLLFNKTNSEAIKAPKAADDGSKKTTDDYSETCFGLPLLATDVKVANKLPFKCELSAEEVKNLRNIFLRDRNHEYFIGFEIVDAIFKYRGKLHSFRFPLYYMKINIEESGRNIFVHPEPGIKIYLNHLALANLVESFGQSSGMGDPVDQFFKNLLSQKIEIKGKLTSVSLVRALPIDDAIFDKTRQILIGNPGESGRGGIFDNLKTIGLECDLESVFLYKSKKISSPVGIALEKDLDDIKNIAYDYPQRFYDSLLGNFLTPELDRCRTSDAFCQRSYMPGSLPQSTRRLLERLKQHDLVLLEGPPGTGKTYTNMNLFFHCVNSGKKLLFVSDQKAAIHALIEKLSDYLVGKDHNSSASKNLIALWKTAIKVVDDLPTDDSIASLAGSLKKMLGLENPKELEWPQDDNAIEEEIIAIDEKIKKTTNEIQSIMDARLGKDSDIRKRVAPKYMHATTKEDIEGLVAFLKFISQEKNLVYEDDEGVNLYRYLIMHFIKDREYLQRVNPECYDFLSIKQDNYKVVLEKTKSTNLILQNILDLKPKSLFAFRDIVKKTNNNEIIKFLSKRWEAYFPQRSFGIVRFFRYILGIIKHPLLLEVKLLKGILTNQERILDLIPKLDPNIPLQLESIHEALRPSKNCIPSLSLEICRFTIESLCRGKGDNPQTTDISIYQLLEQIGELQTKRDQLIKKRYISQLGSIARSIFSTSKNGGTAKITRISSLLDNLKAAGSIESGSGVAVLRELQEELIDTFPIWLCRKQAVPLLFPCKELSFDLVIVDEAGQCRVDDALPLLFRAQKLMAVGDDKQTVLAKDSPIDDYLFREFDLDEHLRATGAHGIKGGGSNLIGLVKTIKQACVMLDEHYRCPPDIIEFSNRYVYGGDLKVMQWMSSKSPPAVIINHGEKEAASNIRQTRGRFKGIETEMVDRFLKYIQKSIKQIEQETKIKINMEKDVAICYFLLKNEPYIKSVKADFLQKLSRGEDVLDGAGAALQGKERDYIFYLWDITRSNMMAFKQGDDPDKRKGELNVLMSRPKKRAYHYLHQNFASLNHGSASITDYLWKKHNASTKGKKSTILTPRTRNPGKEFIPWQRSSGQMIEAILKHMLAKTTLNDAKLNTQYSVVVGNPSYKIDLMVLADKAKNSPNIGIIDICAFDTQNTSAQHLVDYYFQLQRAVPKIKPIFLFIYELTDESSAPFKALSKYYEGS